LPAGQEAQDDFKSVEDEQPGKGDYLDQQHEVLQEDVVDAQQQSQQGQHQEQRHTG
jgi:hypothetical protein